MKLSQAMSLHMMHFNMFRAMPLNYSRVMSSLHSIHQGVLTASVRRPPPNHAVFNAHRQNKIPWLFSVTFCNGNAYFHVNVNCNIYILIFLCTEQKQGRILSHDGYRR